MPKKFQGGNSKAEEARQRKAAVEDEKKSKLEKDRADAEWKDEDKRQATKITRKAEAVAKTEEKATRRAELKRLVEEEEHKAASSCKKAAAAAPKKLTRAEMAQRQALAAKQKAEQDRRDKESSKEDLLVENPNRVIQQQAAEAAAMGQEFVSASGLDDAVAVASSLSGIKEVDRNPERRAKAAYRAYGERNMPTLRKENPSLKLSQVQEVLWKQWQKSPENPLNQAAA